MSVTLTIDEALLHEAERATNIHDWSALVKKGLQALSQRGSRAEATTQVPFDFDAALAAAAELPDLGDEDFDQFQKEMQRPLPAAWTACD
jgi:hypothetical protein